jgi:hypothetical protein
VLCNQHRETPAKAATISTAEAKRLVGNSAAQAVVPDRVVPRAVREPSSSSSARPTRMLVIEGEDAEEDAMA